MGRPVAVVNNNVCGARADDAMNLYWRVFGGPWESVRDTPMRC